MKNYGNTGQKPRDHYLMTLGVNQQRGPTYQSQQNGYRGEFGGERFRGDYHQFESRLLPNEMRISAAGNVNSYFDHACYNFEQGYEHLKIVARGMAVPLAKDLIELLRDKFPLYRYSISNTQSLNKRGFVCAEYHALVSEEKQEYQRFAGDSYQRRFGKNSL